MISLPSALENREDSFDRIREVLEQHRFSLGGNWDYDHGCFDRSLDEAQKVWLRIPFRVTEGHADSETKFSDAVIQIGTPFVLKHVYNEKLDPEAPVQVTGGLFNQFQEPADKDADVEDVWVDKASELLKEVEKALVH